MELCGQVLPTYFVEGPEKLISADEILHFDLHQHKEILSPGYLPVQKPVRILITSGASCPDAMVESVIQKLCDFVPGIKDPVHLIAQFDL